MVKNGFKLKNLLFLLIFAFIAVLSYMTPYMGDNWAWGSQLGIERLQSGFKDYKVFAPIISHFVGSIIGCAIMFTNGAYLNVANSNDDYRTMETSSKGLIKQIEDNLLSIIRKELALNNVMLNIILTLLCTILVFTYLKKVEKTGNFKRLLICDNLFRSIILYSLCHYSCYLSRSEYFCQLHKIF